LHLVHCKYRKIDHDILDVKYLLLLKLNKKEMYDLKHLKAFMCKHNWPILRKISCVSTKLYSLLPPFRLSCCMIFLHSVLKVTFTHFMYFCYLLVASRYYFNKQMGAQVQLPVKTLAKRRKYKHCKAKNVHRSNTLSHCNLHQIFVAKKWNNHRITK